MYTFPFVIFFNVFQLIPVVTPVEPTTVVPYKTTKTYLVSTKCPSELVGVKTPGSKVYHSFIDLGLSCINSGSFIHKSEFKQVCV